MKEIKMWLDLRGEKLLSLFQLVPGVGIEPTRPKTGDFKSPASTIPPPRREPCLLYGRAHELTNNPTANCTRSVPFHSHLAPLCSKPLRRRTSPEVGAADAAERETSFVEADPEPRT